MSDKLYGTTESIGYEGDTAKYWADFAVSDLCSPSARAAKELAIDLIAAQKRIAELEELLNMLKYL